MKTFWLSFCDAHRPKGQQFLGVIIIDVTVEMAADMIEALKSEDMPLKEGAEWIAAAIRETWATKCNPGGDVQAVEITHQPEGKILPRNKLLSLDELKVYGAV